MTSKFQIFCDEPQQPVEKREPLAPKQHVTTRLKLQEPLQQQQPSQQPLPLQQHRQASQESTVAHPPSQAPSKSSASSLDQDQEEQENDISIASLGSDFVPSIVNEEFDSFECEEEANLTHQSWNSDECRHADTEDHQLDLLEHNSLLVDDDDDEFDIDLDEEAQKELDLALKKHDESALFNCIVFQSDILEYLRELEVAPEVRPISNYMLFHQEIDSEKRSILINWLVEVSEEYELQTETLFICVSIIDRFLSKMSISTSHFQLLGVAAMFVATKYEEIYPPELSNFVEVTDETFTGKQIIQMEQEILKTLDFRISMPTVSYFLRQIFTCNKFPRKVYNLAEYLCFLSLLEDQPILEYYPSDIALAAVILAAHTLGSAANISSELKSSYDKSNLSQAQRRDASTGSSSSSSNNYNRNNKNHSPPNDKDDLDGNSAAHMTTSTTTTTSKDLPFCIETLRALQERVSPGSAVYAKFSSVIHDQVALLPPLRLEDLHKCA